MLEDSLYQRAKIHPLVFGALTVGGVAALAALLNSRKTKRTGNGDHRATARKNFTSNAPQGIREHMEVVGSDGSHVGTVDAVEGDRIKLTRKESADGQHHFIPMSLIESAEQERVTLRLTADEIRRSLQNGTLIARA